ncbi:uncharacterized protein [Nicotiana sylvestris]|uniref:uncharacterized protein n=1 Tax=Nicotiana sylvestris TaxID=4096 RepID=UPI00388C4BC0
MAKTSKTVPQKEEVSSSSRTTKGLGEAVLMREPPPGEADILKPAKEKKRKKKSLVGSLNPKKALKLSNQAFSKSQAKLVRCEDKFRKLVSELGELKALHAQKEGELVDLQAYLERISREQADLDEQLKQKYDLMREELRVRDTEILRLKQHMDEMSSNKETLREKLTSVECQLQGARGESRKCKALHAERVADLSVAKSEATALMSSYRKDVVAANARARKMSKEADLKLSRALEHARLRSRR